MKKVVVLESDHEGNWQDKYTKLSHGLGRQKLTVREIESLDNKPLLHSSRVAVWLCETQQF